MPWRERDQVIEAFAIFKFVKAAGLIAIGFGATKLLQPSSEATLQRWIFALSTSDEHPLIYRLLTKLVTFTPEHVQLVGAIALVYAMLYMIEGIGLWHESKWAEYLTVIMSGLFIPLEAYELTRHLTAPLSVALVINLVIVIYLVYRLRHPEERVKLM